MDFFVAATYLSVAVGIFAIAEALLLGPTIDVGSLVIGLVALGLAYAWYRSAVSSTSYWDSTVRALVNLGRVPLAAALGLRLPPTIDQERKMWALVVRFAYYGFEEGSAVRLDEFRAKDTANGPKHPRRPRDGRR